MVGVDLIKEMNALLEGYIILGRDYNDEFMWKPNLRGSSLLNMPIN